MLFRQMLDYTSWRNMSTRAGQLVSCTASHQCDYNSYCHPMLEFPRIAKVAAHEFTDRAILNRVSDFREWANKWGLCIAVAFLAFYVVRLCFSLLFKTAIVLILLWAIAMWLKVVYVQSFSA